MVHVKSERYERTGAQIILIGGIIADLPTDSAPYNHCVIADSYLTSPFRAVSGDLTLPIASTAPNNNLGSTDADSDQAWARTIQQDAEISLGGSVITKSSDVLDEKTLVPFLRDYGVHHLLSKQSPEECLALFLIPKHAASPLTLQRLYKIVSESFLADCDMAVNMNPTVRRLIMHDNLYVIIYCTLCHVTYLILDGLPLKRLVVPYLDTKT